MNSRAISSDTSPRNRMTRIREWIVKHDDDKVFLITYLTLAVVLSTFISLFWLLVVVAIHMVLEYIKENDGQSSAIHIWSRVMWELKLDIALIFFSFVIHLYMGFIIGVAGLGGAARAGAGAARAGAGAARAGAGAARAGAGAARAGAGAARAGASAARAVQTSARVAQSGTRFVIIQRTIRAGLMMLDEAVLVARGIWLGKQGRNSNEAGNYAPDNNESNEAGNYVPDNNESNEKTGEEQPQTSTSVWGGWSNMWTFGDKFSLFLGIASIALILAAPWTTEHNSVSLVMEQVVEELHPWPTE